MDFKISHGHSWSSSTPYVIVGGEIQIHTLSPLQLAPKLSEANTGKVDGQNEWSPVCGVRVTVVGELSSDTAKLNSGERHTTGRLLFHTRPINPLLCGRGGAGAGAAPSSIR